jgi:hypothetical protein
MTDLMSSLWRVSLVLAFNPSLLNSKKCSEGLGLDRLKVNSPCNPPAQDYTDTLYELQTGCSVHSM